MSRYALCRLTLTPALSRKRERGRGWQYQCLQRPLPLWERVGGRGRRRVPLA